MTVKVIESGEVVQHVFWLDLRSRTCGVKLWHPHTGHERCGERRIAELVVIAGTGQRSVICAEVILGERAQEILRDV